MMSLPVLVLGLAACTDPPSRTFDITMLFGEYDLAGLECGGQDATEGWMALMSRTELRVSQDRQWAGTWEGTELTVEMRNERCFEYRHAWFDLTRSPGGLVRHGNLEGEWGFETTWCDHEGCTFEDGGDPCELTGSLPYLAAPIGWVFVNDMLKLSLAAEDSQLCDDEDEVQTWVRVE